MFSTKLSDSFRRLFFAVTRMDRGLRSFNIDFEKPWWYIFKDVKQGVFAVVYFNFFVQIIYNFRFLALGFILSSQRYDVFWVCVGIQLFIDLSSFATNRDWILMYENIAMNVKRQAFERVITVDPIFHSTRSSGQVIGKIDRGVAAYFDYLTFLTETTLPFLVKVFVGVTALFTIDIWSGLVGAGLTVGLIVMNFWGIRINTAAFLQQSNDADDGVKQNLVEGISQVAYIRSTFATTEILSQFQKNTFKHHTIYATKWRAFNWIIWPLWMVFMGGIFVIIFHVMGKLSIDQSQSALYISAVSTFMFAGSDIWLIGYNMDKMLTAQKNIEELYQFIRAFGKQTYPVLEG